MNQIQEDTIRLFAELKTNDPARYQEILDHECPESYGLPCYKFTNTCHLQTCEKCWREALKIETEPKKSQGHGQK